MTTATNIKGSDRGKKCSKRVNYVNCIEAKKKTTGDKYKLMVDMINRFGKVFDGHGIDIIVVIISVSTSLIVVIATYIFSRKNVNKQISEQRKWAEIQLNEQRKQLELQQKQFKAEYDYRKHMDIIKIRPLFVIKNNGRIEEDGMMLFKLIFTNKGNGTALDTYITNAVGNITHKITR